MDRTAKERMASMRERRAKTGIVQVQVYVHETRREEIRQIAKTMLERKD